MPRWSVKCKTRAYFSISLSLSPLSLLLAALLHNWQFKLVLIDFDLTKNTHTDSRTDGHTHTHSLVNWQFSLRFVFCVIFFFKTGFTFISTRIFYCLLLLSFSRLTAVELLQLREYIETQREIHTPTHTVSQLPKPTHTDTHTSILRKTAKIL